MEESFVFEHKAVSGQVRVDELDDVKIVRAGDQLGYTGKIEEETHPAIQEMM